MSESVEQVEMRVLRTSMIFVDGTNLDRALEEKFFRNDVQFSKLFAALAEGTKLLHTFYATAPYKKEIDPSKYARQMGSINWIRSLPDTTVSLQTHRTRITKCPACGRQAQTPKEKGTDVAVAAAFVEAAVSRAAEDLILVSNDSDFGPLFPLAKRFGCKPVLAYAIGASDSDYKLRLSLAPMSHDAQRVIRINGEFLGQCWLPKK